MRTGAILAVIGAILLLLAAPVGHFSENLPPLVVVPGAAAFGIGVLLFSVGLRQASIVSGFVAVFLVIGAVAVLAANDQDWRILFLVPFGLAWIVAGVALVKQR
jgi:hypothetical protein